MLALSHAAPLVSHGEYADGTDGQTDGRQTVTLCFPLDADSIIIKTISVQLLQRSGSPVPLETTPIGRSAKCGGKPLSLTLNIGPLCPLYSRKKTASRENWRSTVDTA